MRVTVGRAVAFVIAGVALYWRGMTAGFVGDDWPFLSSAAAASSIAVVFRPLVGRFIRPTVVLVYYLGYRLFGLRPLPFHLAVVLVHCANAWMLSRIATAVDRQHRAFIGICAGVLFLAFAGHTEAVTWVAGMADPLALFFMLASLLCLERALQDARPGAWVALGTVTTLLALLSKESAVVAPVVASVYALVRVNGTARGRAFLFVLLQLGAAAVLWLVRIRVFGDPLSAYGGSIGGRLTDPAVVLAHIRALVLRSMLPPSGRVEALWSTGRDVPWLVAGLVLLGIVAAVSRRNRSAILFGAAATAIALAPAVPLLSISLATTETERVVYAGTAFAAIAIVATVDALASIRVFTIAIVAALVAGNAMLLQTLNGRWQAAGLLFETTMRSFVAEGDSAEGRVFLLNLPDNLHGAYVFRSAFHQALPFFSPALARRAASITIVDLNGLMDVRDRIRAEQDASGALVVDVAPNIFYSVAPPVTPFYTFTEWTRSRYRLRFTDSVGSGVALAVVGGRTRRVADVHGPGLPFGVLEIPSDGAACNGRVRFSGWALGEHGIAAVLLTFDAPESRPPGEAIFVSGTRPDVARAYAAFPNANRAEWDYAVDCQALRRTGGAATVRIRAVAIDNAGRRAELGARTIRLID